MAKVECRMTNFWDLCQPPVSMLAARRAPLQARIARVKLGTHASRPPRDGFAVANMLVSASHRNDLPNWMRKVRDPGKLSGVASTRRLRQRYGEPRMRVRPPENRASPFKARCGRSACRYENRCDRANGTRDYPSWLSAPHCFSRRWQSRPRNCTER